MTYLLDQVVSAGIQSVVLCTGHQGDQVKASLGHSYRTLELIYSQETSPLDTGGALRQALPLIQSDPVLVLNGDSFFDLNLPGFIQWHEAHEARATVALVHMHDTRGWISARTARWSGLTKKAQRAARALSMPGFICSLAQ